MKLAAGAAGLAALLVIAITFAYSSASAEQAQTAKVARGNYLVHEVARCTDCHTPMDEKGEPVPGKDLKGTVLVFKPVGPMPVWADKSPNIAGLRGWEEDAAIKFLMTGIAYNDLPARPPMPSYHMHREDAEAIVAYLQSLSPTGK